MLYIPEHVYIVGWIDVSSLSNIIHSSFSWWRLWCKV